MILLWGSALLRSPRSSKKPCAAAVQARPLCRFHTPGRMSGKGRESPSEPGIKRQIFTSLGPPAAALFPWRLAGRNAPAPVEVPALIAAIDADHFLVRRSLRRLACRAALQLAFVELLRLLVLAPGLLVLVARVG